jgi:hypothetical protein
VRGGAGDLRVHPDPLLHPPPHPHPPLLPLLRYQGRPGEATREKTEPEFLNFKGTQA